MSRTKSTPKAGKKGGPGNAVAVAAGVNGPAPEVMTLAEAAAYLRLPEDEVTRLVHQQGLPGRYTGTEWRFLKSGIQDWLRAPPTKARDAKAFWDAQFGALKDDPYLEDMLKEIYKRRGRPETEGG